MTANCVTISGKKLVCTHCEADTFHREYLKLNRMLRGVVRLEGHWGRNAMIYSCSECGFMHFFSSAIDVEKQVPDDPVECLSCSGLIAPDVETCPSCGYVLVE